jgi:hypothetical protein
VPNEDCIDVNECDEVVYNGTLEVPMHDCHPKVPLNPRMHVLAQFASEIPKNCELCLHFAHICFSADMPVNFSCVQFLLVFICID